MSYREPSPTRLYRNKTEGMFGGVCAGIAEYFGLEPTMTRIVTFVLMLFFPALLLVYLALVFLLPVKPDRLYRDEHERDFWRGIRTSPAATFSDVRHRFRSLDARLQRLERYVTSRDYNLDREFRDLERDSRA
jgi:phage shock protein C